MFELIKQYYEFLGIVKESIAAEYACYAYLGIVFILIFTFAYQEPKKPISDDIGCIMVASFGLPILFYPLFVCVVLVLPLILFCSVPIVLACFTNYLFERKKTKENKKRPG